GDGADQLLGGLGDDVLRGEGGGDRLWGGGGGDRFEFRAFAESAPGAPDRIIDFDGAEGDRIVLGALVPGRFDFIGAAAFTAGAGAQLRFDVAGGVTRIEASTTGSAVDLVIELQGVLTPGAGDFVL
ncbi:MAG: hypothetical protein K2X74_21700, partial [Acetobacteraceae bacterium]|nr:hypothetical protein [Acetobacteraceae bacterium]